jgi:adenosylhomocysteine nucleosidase
MQPPATVLCTSGLAVEAKIARAAGFSVVIGAADRDRTAALVATAAAQTDWLVSFGIAGGLSPELKAGTVIVSGEVVSERCRWSVAPSHRRQLTEFARSIGAMEGTVFGASAILATKAEKKRAWTMTRSLAVDLESEIVARTASALGLPFIVLRAIADTAHRELPPASLVPLGADGRPRVTRVFASMMRRPSQFAEVFGLAQEARLALSALVGPAQALRGLLGTA